MINSVEAIIGQQSISIETGKLAKQASGSVLIRSGETVVLVTAVGEKVHRPELGFLPLTIEYQEKLASVGKIPGNYFRREIGRPSEQEVLTCRIIDRPLRPLFAPGYRAETQVIASVLSADQHHPPDILALTGASCALSLSDIPFAGPVAGGRVGCIDGEFIINPTFPQLERSTMDIVVACTKNAIVMVEGQADELGEQQVLDAIFFGFEQLQPLIDLQEKLQAVSGKPKREVDEVVVDEDLRQQVYEFAKGSLEQIITTADKLERGLAYDALKTNVRETFDPESERGDELDELLSGLRKQMMRARIAGSGQRIDGRELDQVRPISCEAGYLPRTHGSALFTRGETQALVTATLGSERDQQRIETLGGEENKRFMLHYNFPPFCVGEVRRLSGPSRRDIGHGTLARRGIEPVLPDDDSFPYSIRVVSEVLESNGSSSMATVCGGSMALMDAGVPIKTPVAGIAMGLIKEDDQVAVLSDILGDEDHLGDMDFKVVGTGAGVTSLQMDIKIEGVDKGIMGRALEQAKAGRLHILAEMNKSIAEARAEISSYAPKYHVHKINPDKIRDIIGPGGKIIKELSAEYDAKIEVEDSGLVKIFTGNGSNFDGLLARIKELTAEPEVGAVYQGVVKTIKDFGAFVEIMPGTDGLVHISELDKSRVGKVTDIVQEGDEIEVKVLEIDSRGRIRLSRKALL
ncbi:MAG: polyribonucleotide nucleotidyltransferase [Desulfofustis sp. PB-SRB1]|jgi:polyribonucleotide nucleotidyltransferase|nr:polyribonucleotide nucleotidyltransferase [Desulfofustis sp. PB-SRB1]MBM1003080.1 polyribonucleotide nucleotidyltransferase [Desulfofustis sp. PB-SRB1]HBH29647.1 polyribonucleotide nucleotidyltransferase [Desulfofustis sp.]